MRRTIKFKAYLEVGDNKELKAIIEDVTVYDDGKAGIDSEDFCAAIEKAGWKWDGDEFTKDGVVIDGYKNDVFSGEDWIFFNGIPLQFTGLKDKNGNDIYECDIVDCGGTVYVCKWNAHRCEFAWYSKDGSYVYPIGDCRTNLEVIGQFLENILLPNNAPDAVKDKS